VARAAASLQAVDEALARLLDGSYGTCSSCGSAISPDELAENPAAGTHSSCCGAVETEPQRAGPPGAERLDTEPPGTEPLGTARGNGGS
ncbi:MAG TPA: hypothetical protein VMD59_00240, partial [Acidimicrobiales bacterium]|nr:hypothetical protein [Acidimicrobiales bacterium]